MKDVQCLLCGCTENTIWAEIKPGKEILHHKYVKCVNCGLVFANPQADPKEMKQYYQNTYYRTADLSFMKNKAFQNFLRKRLNTVQKYKNKGALLDIGCGPGVSLTYFRRHGYSVLGLEPGIHGTENSHLNPDFSIIHDFYPSPRITSRQFDIIYCWHVIEHIDNPVNFLMKIHRNLKDDGILVLGTENISWYCKFSRVLYYIAGSHSHTGTSSDHTFFPARPTLSRIIKIAGFTILEYNIYDDSIKGHPLQPKNFYNNRSFKSMLSPINHLRWIIATICYFVGNLLNAGGSKCEIVAVKNKL